MRQPDLEIAISRAVSLLPMRKLDEVRSAFQRIPFPAYACLDEAPGGELTFLIYRSPDGENWLGGWVLQQGHRGSTSKSAA